MPFDPLSTISYVATIAGLVSFLASTVPRLDQVARDFREYSERLRWYHIQFQTCHMHLSAWKAVWCSAGKTYSDEDYEYFWGSLNFEAMKSRFELVSREIDVIGLILYGQVSGQEINTAPERWSEWQRQLADLKSGRRPESTHGRWLEKMRFALLRGAELDERTKRLQESIKNLREVSKFAFWTAQSLQEVNDGITENDLRRLINRKQRLDDLSMELESLYRECTSWGAWSLVLSPPDEEGGPSSIDYDCGYDILIEFDAWKSSQASQAHRNIGITSFRLSEAIDMNTKDYLDLILSKARAGDLIKPHQRTGLWQSIRTNFDPLQTKRMLIHTALGLVNWTTLLWDSSWTNGICPCGIQFIQIRNPQTREAATFTPADLDIDPNVRCSSCNLGERKALLLGSSLAQLAIRRKIRVVLNEEDRRGFYIGEDTRLLSDEQLIEEVRKCCPGFLGPVEYCLYYDRKLAAGEFSFRPGHIVQFKEQVLDKLENYHRAIQQQRRFRQG